MLQNHQQQIPDEERTISMAYPMFPLVSAPASYMPVPVDLVQRLASFTLAHPGGAGSLTVDEIRHLNLPAAPTGMRVKPSMPGLTNWRKNSERENCFEQDHSGGHRQHRRRLYERSARLHPRMRTRRGRMPVPGADGLRFHADRRMAVQRESESVHVVAYARVADGLYSREEPYEGAVEALNQLHDAGWNIIMATSRADDWRGESNAGCTATASSSTATITATRRCSRRTCSSTTGPSHWRRWPRRA